MHLVFLNQYYPPDAAPTGLVLRDVAEVLTAAGHQVTVLCAKGGYAEAGAEVSTAGRPLPEHAANAPRVLRIAATQFGRRHFMGKLIDYGSYYFGVAWKLLLLRPRPDRIIALTTPPYLSVLARGISRIRGADHAHWVMDLYPDVMVAHRLVSEQSHLYRFLAGLSRWGFGGRRCALVLTLGPDMMERTEALRNAGRGTRRAEWVPLWGTGGGERRTSNAERRTLNVENFVTLRRRRGWGDDELVLMYSGNMGLGHRFGEVLAAVKALSGSSDREQEGGQGRCGDGTSSGAAGKRVRFVFYGGGKRRGEVLEFFVGHPDCRMEIHNYVPAELLTTHLQSADVHLASLASEWTGTMVPSKLQGIFEVGRPVIFIGSAESSIGRWVSESCGGWVIEPGDVDGLLVAIAEAGDPHERSVRGMAARAFADRHFRKEINATRVAELFGSITASECPKV